eukprot:scaffold118722_cov60-Phaeocystis_antarctica.AAC.6
MVASAYTGWWNWSVRPRTTAIVTYPAGSCGSGSEHSANQLQARLACEKETYWHLGQWRSHMPAQSATEVMPCSFGTHVPDPPCWQSPTAPGISGAQTPAPSFGLAGLVIYSSLARLRCLLGATAGLAPVRCRILQASSCSSSRRHPVRSCVWPSRAQCLAQSRARGEPAFGATGLRCLVERVAGSLVAGLVNSDGDNATN